MVQLGSLREAEHWCSTECLFVLEIGELKLGTDVWLGLVSVVVGARTQTQQ